MEVLVEKWAMISLILNGLEKYDTKFEIPLMDIDDSMERNELLNKNIKELNINVKDKFDSFMGENRKKLVQKQIIENKNNVENTQPDYLFGDDKLIDYLSGKYARDDLAKTGFNSEKFLVNRMKFLYDCIIKEKRKEALLLILKGYEKKKKSFMRRIISDPYLSAQIMK